MTDEPALPASPDTAGAGTPILAAVSGIIMTRLESDRGASEPAGVDLRGSAERHRQIYRPIRARGIRQAPAATHARHRTAAEQRASPPAQRTSRRQRWRQPAS